MTGPAGKLIQASLPHLAIDCQRLLNRGRCFPIPRHAPVACILDDRGKGVFNGKIFVREDAQKTDAKQTNKVMLLSDDATIDTKPQLEIFADDVKCTHGATIGQLDETQMFYLKSRGIGDDHARSILLHAFAADIVERVEVEALRAHLERLLLERLPID